MAEPAMVAIPETKPLTWFRASKKKEAVKSSGNELETALIVAPRTPWFHPRPMTSEIFEIDSLENQMIAQEAIIPMRTNTPQT